MAALFVILEAQDVVVFPLFHQLFCSNYSPFLSDQAITNDPKKSHAAQLPDFVDNLHLAEFQLSSLIKQFSGSWLSRFLLKCLGQTDLRLNPKIECQFSSIRLSSKADQVSSYLSIFQTKRLARSDFHPTQPFTFASASFSLRFALVYPFQTSVFQHNYTIDRCSTSSLSKQKGSIIFQFTSQS